MPENERTPIDYVSAGPIDANTYILGIKTTSPYPYKSKPADIGHLVGDAIFLNQGLKGVANGLAELDSTGKVPSSQLPSYVDDVVEGYYYNSKFYKESTHVTEITPESGKIYLDVTEGSNRTYRWGGSSYAEVSPSLALGETSATAYRGDRGKIAYDHSQLTSGNPHHVSYSDVGAVEANSAITAGTKCKITYDSKGLVTGGANLQASDIPALSYAGLASGASSGGKAASAAVADSADAVALANVSDADDLKAIEALTGTSGLLKKTAANTWSLDTNTYSLSTHNHDTAYAALNHTHSYAGSASVGGPANDVAAGAGTDAADRYVYFAYNDTTYNPANVSNVTKAKPVVSSNFKFNPNTGNLTVTQIGGKNVSDLLTSHQSLADYVQGPASAVDAKIAIFDGTTGKKIKDSGYTIATSVPANAVFTDTTYSNKAAVSGGTEVSLVTTGDKYTWNNKSDLTLGNTASTAAYGNHTHSVSIAADSGTSLADLSANTKYKLTAGGSTLIFKTPVDTTYSNKAAASGGTEVSLVTTGEKYTWNSKTSNTGTVTSVTIKASSPISIDSSSAITTSGERTISHATSGPSSSADTSKGDTTAQTPTFGGTFKALSATVDKYGHTTALGEHTVTIPATLADTSTVGLVSKDGIQTFGGVKGFNGDIRLTENKVFQFRPNNDSYYTNIKYDTYGNEALVVATKNAVTSFIVKSGDTASTISTVTQWNSFVPSIQVKRQSLYVNKLIDHNVTPDKNFWVEGDSRLNGNVYVGSGSAYISYDSTTGAICFNS